MNGILLRRSPGNLNLALLVSSEGNSERNARFHALEECGSLVVNKVSKVNFILSATDNFFKRCADFCDETALFADPSESREVLEGARARVSGEDKPGGVANDLPVAAFDDALLRDVGEVDTGANTLGGDLISGGEAANRTKGEEQST